MYKALRAFLLLPFFPLILIGSVIMSDNFKEFENTLLTKMGFRE